MSSKSTYNSRQRRYSGVPHAGANSWQCNWLSSKFSQTLSRGMCPNNTMYSFYAYTASSIWYERIIEILIYLIFCFVHCCCFCCVWVDFREVSLTDINLSLAFALPVDHLMAAEYKYHVVSCFV